MLKNKERLESLAKKADESIDEFEAHLIKSMPNGLNARLSRPERAILKTYIMWWKASLQSESADS